MDRDKSRDIVGPVILILAGIVLLLNTTGVIPWSVWADIGRYWPVLLIVSGLGIIFGRKSFIGPILGVLAIVAVVVLSVFGAGSFGANRAMGEPAFEEDFVVSSSNYNPASVRLTADVAAADMRIVTVPYGDILTGHAEYHRQEGKPSVSELVAGSTLEIRYIAGKRLNAFVPLLVGERDSHRLELGRTDIPTALDLSVGAGQLHAELGGLAVSDVFIDVGGGSVNALFGGPSTTPMATGSNRLRFKVGAGKVDIAGLGNTSITTIDGDVGSGKASIDFSSAGELVARKISADVQVGAGRLSVDIPRGMGVRVVADVGAGGLYVNGEKRSTRDLGSHGSWESPDYLTASSTVDLVIQVGAGKIEVRTGR